MLTLTGSLPAWDLERKRADVSRLIAFLDFSRVRELTNAEQALRLSQQFSFSLSTGEGKALVHQLVRETLPSLPWNELAIQTVPHVRVLIPGDAVAPVPPHTDHDIGHSLFERNLWFALTDARGTAALRVATFARSMQLAAARPGPFFPLDLELPVVEAERGDVLLFTPLHAHAAQTNRETYTRVSMDLRIAPRSHVQSRALRTFVPMKEAPIAVSPSPAPAGEGRGEGQSQTASVSVDARRRSAASVAVGKARTASVSTARDVS